MTKPNTMRSHDLHCYSHRHLLVQSSILLFLGTFSAAQAASDILSKGSNLTYGETLVSANGSFTLGFFSRGVPARRYLGIWFTVSNSSGDAVCWVANRDHPLGDTSGVLAISDTGSLVLLDGSGRTAWSSNTTAGAASPTVKLLESGNLVLLDGNGGRDDYDVVKLWQSFDHPTNTLLPGAKIGINLWSGGGWSLTSWRNADDPSPGEFRYTMVRRGLLPEIVTLDSSDAIKYRTGVWNGRWFSGIPEMNSFSNMFVFQVTVSPSEVSYSYAAKAGAPPRPARRHPCPASSSTTRLTPCASWGGRTSEGGTTTSRGREMTATTTTGAGILACAIILQRRRRGRAAVSRASSPSRRRTGTGETHLAGAGGTCRWTAATMAPRTGLSVCRE